MNNIDFISEKWRTCRRTRNLARIHFASYITTIIYVAVYAEAQRRDEDYKEFGAAVAALMFNVFQVLRTIMGIVQLNAFVAWCKDAAECMRALSGKDGEDIANDRDSRAEISEQPLSSQEENSQLRSGGAMRKLFGVLRLGIVATLCKRGIERIRNAMGGNNEKSMQNQNSDEENVVSSWDVYMQDKDHDEDEDLEEKIRVNNTVVDNELGGRELTVFPSLGKMCKGLKEGSLVPSKWLKTDRVMLNTVRWSGAYLCGMGERWSVGKDIFREKVTMLEKFFSWEMRVLRRILQCVEWNIELENDGHELVSIQGIAGYGQAELTGEMSTAYGTGFDAYEIWDTYNVELYSFEFNSLVSSYPASDEKLDGGNRESVKVGLAHSVVLAKHLGTEKLKAIRKYYDNYRVPFGSIRENAFRLLQQQKKGSIPEDDCKIWDMFGSIISKIPLFPYRMQAVALWDKATNWRVLQASAHQDIIISLECSKYLETRNDEMVLLNVRHRANIFNYCTEWSKQHLTWRSSLGIVIETVRTFLAEWMIESAREPDWKPKILNDSIEFGLGETRIELDSKEDPPFVLQHSRIVWVCQRELQRKVAQIENKDENLPGNVALMMLFLLGFPVLSMEKVQDAEFGTEESQEVQETNTASCFNRHGSLDLSVQSWRAWTVLAPQDISLMIRVDLANRTVSLRLRNGDSDAEFKWQDWADAAMGCLKGFEESLHDELRYGRTIVKANLHNPIVELCPVRTNESGIEPVLEKVSVARVWTGWLPFDARICKFELDQWLAVCDIKLDGVLAVDEHWAVEDEVLRAECAIKDMISKENEEIEK